jgi:hypothetical protein
MAKKKEQDPQITEEKEVTPAPLPVVTEEEKIEFFKAFISDKPFTNTSLLFNKALSVVFKSLTTRENMVIYDQVRKEQLDGELTNDANYVTTLSIYRLASALQSLNDVPFDVPTGESLIDDIKAKAKIIKDWPVFKTAAIMEAFKVFEDKVVHLTREVQTENFWPADK